jgi:hypothetical protein
MPAAALPLIGMGTSLVGGLIGSNSANNAAQAQRDAANKAADYLKGNSQQALDFQNNQWGQTQNNFAPYLQSGQGANNALQYGLGIGGSANGSGVGQGSLLQGYQGFTAPTGLDMQNDPGYMERLKLGTDALQKSAAARGSVLTGGTAKALDSYAQDYASNEYGNVYGRALQGYQTNANNFYTNQGNQFNRLSALANSGQQAAGTLGGLGQSASNNVSQNLLSTGQNVANQINNAGAATASGYVQSGNSWGQGIANAGDSLGNLLALKQGKYGAGSSYVLPTFSPGVQTSSLNSYSYEPDYSTSLG